MNLDIIIVTQTAILYVPSHASMLLVRAIITLRKAFTFLYWIRHPLCETEMASHDANVTMVTKVAGEHDGYTANESKLPNKATDSCRR